MLRIPRRLVPLALAGLGATALLAPVAASADTQHSAAATASARWLSGELRDGALPGPFGDNPDWGLTIDALIALEATGADPAAARAVSDAVADHVADYNSYAGWGGDPDVRIGGATAKILYAAVASGADPADFGGFDMRAETLDLVQGPGGGANQGRISDRDTGSDNSNSFGQSLGVLGLARSGGVPQEAVDFLIRQQCSEGGFRLSPDQFGTPAPTCDEAANPVLDPDSTGMAVQALLAAAEDGAEGAAASAELGSAWLEEIQREDGSFGGSGPTAASNTNSTGLAGQALAATGRDSAADAAADWILAHQLTDASGAAAAESGAIAYNADSRDSAVADGIPGMQRDQWRRASAQALLGLAGVPLGEIGSADGPGPTDPPTTGPTTGPTDPPTTGPTAGPTTGPTEGPTTGPTADPTAGPTPGPTAGPTPGPTDVPGGRPDDAPKPSDQARGPLAVTGAALTSLVVAALVLVVAGATLFVAARRRGTHP